MSLPNTYTRLTYIESSGTQYINTNLPKQAYSYLGVDMIMMKVGSVSYDYLFGQYSGANGCYFANSYGDNFNFLIGTDVGSTYGNIPMSQNVLYDLKTHISGTDGYVNYNGTIIERSNLNSVTISREFLLFAGDHQNGNIYYSKSRIYKCKIYGNNQELLRDFIPAKRNTDSVLGLYDLVNDVFYTNSGSGTFIGGTGIKTSVNPEGSGSVDISTSADKFVITATPNPTYSFTNWLLKGYTQLEYIQSSGTQKIEFTMPQINSANVKVEAHCEWVSRTSSSQNVSLFYFSASSGGYGLDINNDYGKARFYVATSWWDITELSLGTPYTIETIGNTLKINGTSYSKSGSVTFSGLARIFAGNGGIGTLKISSYKVWNSDTLIFDFIPVIRHSDGAIGLLDLVHLKFYGNSGTGTFIGGPIKEVA